MATFVPLLPIPIQYQDAVTSVNMSAGTLEFFLAGTSTPTNLFSDNSGTSIGTSITLNSGGMPESGGNVITLFRDSAIGIKIIGKDALGATIFTSDDLEDGLTILASTSNAKGASLIAIEDSAADFVAEDVEAALAELNVGWLNLTRSGQTVTQSIVFSLGASFNDAVVSRANFKDCFWKRTTESSSSGSIDFDISDGNAFDTVLTENITTITFSNVPAGSTVLLQVTIMIVQDGAGGAYDVTWPASVLWAGGGAPDISPGNDAVDLITLQTYDSGTTWLGNFSQAFS